MNGEAPSRLNGQCIAPGPARRNGERIGSQPRESTQRPTKRSKPRPQRRPIEREYLAVLNDVVTVDAWRRICQTAVDAALAGNARARDWLSRWLMEPDARPLTVLAAEEIDATVEAVADDEVKRRREALDDDRRNAEQERLLLNLCRNDFGKNGS